MGVRCWASAKALRVWEVEVSLSPVQQAGIAFHLVVAAYGLWHLGSFCFQEFKDILCCGFSFRFKVWGLVVPAIKGQESGFRLKDWGARCTGLVLIVPYSTC